MNEERDDLEGAYLWDRSDPPDPSVQRLEALLGRYAWRDARSSRVLRMADGARARRSKRVFVRVAIAAGAVLACAVIWKVLLPEGASAGGYVVQGDPKTGWVGEGEWMETGAAGVLLEIGDIGTVDVGEHARLLVERSGRELHRLFLERGRISAVISADPEVFQIETPAGLSIDLGCFYELEVAPDGSTSIVVRTGAVSFDGKGRHIIVPTDAKARATRRWGPSSPVYLDSSDELLARVERVEFADEPEVEEVERVLAELTSLTVWHLLQARSLVVRERAYERLLERSGAPAGIDRARVLAGDRAERELWLADLAWFEKRFRTREKRGD